MHDLTIAWQDIAILLTHPLFTLGDTPVSPIRLFFVLMAIIVALWLARFGEQAFKRLVSHRATHFSAASAYALGRIVRYVLLLGGLLVALSIAGINFSSLAVVGGALGLGVGIGLQPLFANFISGVVLLIDRTLKVGDFIDLQSGVRGRVVEIAMRYTRIATNDSVDVLVPNSEFVNGRVTNWTFDDANRRLHVPFGVAYGSDKNLVREAAVAAAARVEGIILGEPGREPDVWLVSFGDNSLNFELVVWVGQALISTPGRTQAMLLWELETQLTNRELVIPFPQRDLTIKSGKLAVEIIAKSDGRVSL